MHLGIEQPDPAYISLTSRPTRSVVFVAELPGIDWPVTWAAALAAQSTVWGGSANLLLPLYDGIVSSDLLWALIELHDPDSCFVYGGTRADLEELDPDAYKAWRKALDRQLSGTPDEQTRQLDYALSQPLGDWTLPETLGKELVRRGAMFSDNGGQPPSRGPWGIAAPWPLISVLDFADRPRDVIEPPLIADPIQRLLATAELGRFPKRTRDALIGHQSDIKTVTPSSREDLIRWVYGGNRPRGRTPFDVTQIGCEWFATDNPEPPVAAVVVGDHQWDFALAYALRRALGLAFWLPASLSWTPVERQLAIQHIANVASRAGTEIAVTSTSNPEAVEQLSVAISTLVQGHVAVKATPWRDTLPPHSNQLLTEESLGLETAFALDQGRTQALATPIPASVRLSKPESLRWVTEIGVRGWSPWRHAALINGPLLTGTGDSRPSRRGVAYSCPNWLVRDGVPLIHQVRRPSLMPLALLEQIRIAASAGGWESGLSHKGAFALSACSLFGGFEQLCTELRDADLARLLMGYLDGNGDSPGRVLEKRRYLRLTDVQNLELSGHAPALIGRLDSMRVLVRGLVLKCERCRYADFYRARESDPSFSCTRCGHEQRPGPGHWLGSAEPEWHYRLDEAVFQFLRQRGDLPMLAAYDLFARSKETVQIVPEVEFVRLQDQNEPGHEVQTADDEASKPREFDFIVVHNGALYLGEGFAASRYEKTAAAENRRLQYLATIADILSAQAVVLATGAETLDDRTRRAAGNRFRAFSGPRLVIREAVPVPQRPAKLIDEARNTE